ncbi:glycoside hydrolase family 3 C-terminal domain-containing protein [Yinghuangia sp. ASG 101]|uniref:glycoside hydrolase family 3 C-terminal domain-containing protein n=1 Tax=Yinghuangia sp. ASG 101 TaxID=2896848 RepID=UPI001E4EDE07|nr:glycoside hydrolase family 3 C-terminal domain-containing protein [Yinghuangia sp. ASG 101]UGQ12563.1 glycoside hydrolase family 3 C-terminal domain-containing protein [Yinghuangia sp. ASG 101]
MRDKADIEAALAALTLEEKASLLCGAGAWETVGVEHAGVPSIVLTDGPHGLRLQDPGAEHSAFDINLSLPATCFPTAAALGSSWDTGLMARIGEALGAESRAAGVSVLLGPGVNIKRSPLCGRNFEYLSEDPLLSGHLGAALVRGVQSTGVASSVKHFAANNQETERMTVSAEVDERTLREIYLAAFEHIVATERPGTVMAAYNKINGVHAAQNPWLLTRVLRDEWGFEGLVVSDWGAVLDPVAAVAAGLDLEMPSTNGFSARRLVEAVGDGRLEESAIDRAVTRVLELIGRTAAGREPAPEPDLDAHHALARRAAAESAVLLRNEGAVLPLDPDAAVNIAVIGEFARTPRYQGAGSSRVNPTRLDNAWDALREAAGAKSALTFSPGFLLTDAADADTADASGTPGAPADEAAALVSDAVAAAAAADVALVFLGLPEGVESEGHDRDSLDLPAAQIRLLEAVARANPNVVVVLANGGVVEVASWQHHARAVLEGWLGGQAGGGAIADLVFGRANPSGRLAETIPLRLADNPSYLNFPGGEGVVAYGERVYVGYRYYDTVDAPVAYPFGHGLSYTEFTYSDLAAEVEGSGADVVVRVRLTVTNSGAVAGKEVVQVYVGDTAASVDRPARELKAFAKVSLAAGASAPVEFALRARDFSYFSALHGDWVLEPGEFVVHVGASSRDVRLTAAVTVDAPEPLEPLSAESSVARWLADPIGGTVLRAALGGIPGSGLSDPDIVRMVESLPLSRLAALSGGRVDLDDIRRERARLSAEEA